MSPPVWTTVRQLRDSLAPLRAKGERIVLVPTMGDLHEGHLDLVRAGLPFGQVVVSIFVNPTQFAPGEDYENDPRRLEQDRDKLAPLGICGVFAPHAQEIYPQGESTRVEVRGLTEPLCGAHRDGHFLGVTTVCSKLFIASDCDLAVFGQKDAQQCLVIRRMVEDLQMDCELLFVPTRREPGGVAMSSRNRYLEAEERERALALSSALAAGRELLLAGEREVSTVEAAMRAALDAASVRPDYAELRTVPDLSHPQRAEGRVLLAVAAYVGRARLIDNLCLHVADEVSDVQLLDENTATALHKRWSRPT